MIERSFGIVACSHQEHFCQNPRVGEALSLCHVQAAALILQDCRVTVHATGNIQISFTHLCLSNTVLL